MSKKYDKILLTKTCIYIGKRGFLGILLSNKNIPKNVQKSEKRCLYSMRLCTTINGKLKV